MNSEFFSFGRRSASRPAPRQARSEFLESRIAFTATAIAPETLEDIATPLAMDHDPHEGHVMYPGSVMVTPTEVHTHNEIIPRFAAQPTLRSVRSGNWDDPAVWSSGRVPRTGDRVSIEAAHTILLGSQLTARIDTVEVSGTLAFATTRNTRLLVANLLVMPEGHLRIGTQESPVAPQVTAEVIVANKPLNLAADPRQFGTGLIALGEVTIHGASMSQTWQLLATEPRAGDRVLHLSQPITNWQPGDTLVLPDTRQVPASQVHQFIDGAISGQWEEVIIEGVVGQTVVLAAPLKYNHLGARNVEGGLEFLPHVGVLDRNVVIRSENPNGTRGHTMFTARADVNIAFAEFRDLGRTDAFQPLDNTTFDQMGNVTHLGTNQVGRYAVHLHHLMGPENSTNTGYQFQLVGNAITGSKKWAMALHGASFGLVDRNVIYNAQGSGIVTEDGTEIGNQITNNLVIRIQGTYEDGKDGTDNGNFGRGGVGFWFRRGGNIIVGNVTANNTYAGIVISGYNVEPGPLPLFRGADLHDPAQTVDGTLSPSSLLFNNEVYGLTRFGLWAAFINGKNMLPNQSSTYVWGLRLWHIHSRGVWTYHVNNVSFNQVTILGDLNARDRSDTGARGIDLRLYESLNVTINNARIEGMYLGIVAPTNDASQFGSGNPTVIANSVLKNYLNIVVMPPQEGLPAATNALEIRNVKFQIVETLRSGTVIVDLTKPPKNISLWLDGDFIDYTRQSIVRVYSYNQVPGDDFQVFYKEQAQGYVIPRTDPEILGLRDRAPIGSPSSGLTNAQNWSRHGLAVAGAVAPASAALSRPEIDGLVAPIQTPPAVPKVVFLTPWENGFTSTEYIRVRYNVIGTLPKGAQVMVQLDDRPPVSYVSDGGFFNLTPGRHQLRATIVDSSGKQLPGTTVAVSNFTRS